MADSQPPADEGLSKNALKKLEKEKKKAEAKAKAAAARGPSSQNAAPEFSVDDLAEFCGNLSLSGPLGVPVPTTTLEALSSSATSGQEVVIRGSVHTSRKQSAKLLFLNLRHGFASIQAIWAADADDAKKKAAIKWATSIPVASIIVAKGVIKASPEPVVSATISGFELHLESIHVVSRAVEKLPIQIDDAERPIPKETAADAETEESAKAGERPLVALSTRLDNRVVDLKANTNLAIFRVRDGIVALFQEYLRGQGFIGITTPKLIGNESEGGSNVFTVSYFDRNAYLAQSPQLYKQMCIAAGFQRVFEIGPVFRAENSNTPRHLTEFTGLDLEMEYEEDYHDVMSLIENLMLFIFRELNVRYGKETKLVQDLYGVEPFKLPEEGKVPRLTYPEAIQMLRDAGETELGDYDDLSTPQEKLLGALVLKKYDTDFYVLDKFPSSVRPFYTMPDPADEKYSNSYDFFMRGQEIMSGAQRIHDADLLRKRMAELGVNPKGMDSYVNAFTYGCPRHAGGGLGLERILAFWLGLTNVRQACLFPRDPQRLEP